MELNLPQARILIIKMSSLGDIICALPALFALRKKYPHAHITWAVHHAFKDILPGTPYLDDKVVIDRNRLRQPSYWRELHRELRERSFDLVLDLQMLAKSALVARLSGAKARYGYWEAREGSGLVSQPIVGAHQYGHITERLLDVVEYFGADIDRIAYPLCDISDAEVTLR
ncbi:MAG: glycosyltransferase family 9 protein, partial [Negativicoccus succinicivorans]|nr:glycosyltransferase family 9 protein [Negativicoccus succinicivorans]